MGKGREVIKMKLLSATLFGLGLCSIRKPCPNNDWQFNAATGECNPHGVEVTCNPNSITVSFLPNHAYSHGATMDVSNVRAQFNDPNCVISNADLIDGRLTKTFGHDYCGTTIDQDLDEGKIILSNKISGLSYYTEVEGVKIYVQSTLSFTVDCKYTDYYETSTSFDVVEESYNGDVFNAGMFQFEMKSFHDNYYMREIAEATIMGERVYVGIKPVSELHSQLDYFVTDCAVKDPNSAAQIDLIDNFKYTTSPISVLSDFAGYGGVRASRLADHWRGYQFSYPSFSFSEDGGDVTVECALKVCLMENIEAGIKKAPACAAPEVTITPVE